MCTLTLAWQVFPAAPVVVAANRDEATDRPSSSPAVRDDDEGGTGTRVLAPRDDRAGGTWIGVNEHGVFAGITNRWTDSELAGDRSRGLLVDDVLGAQTSADAVGILHDAVERNEYDGFYLTVADETNATVFGWDGALTETPLDPGVHVVVNVGVDDDVDVPTARQDVGVQQAENARRARSKLERRGDESVDEWLGRARSILGDHEYGLCIHADGYGTRSSSLVIVRDDETVTYDYADGPPCETPFESVDHDL